MSLLDQLRTMTTVVADTGDIEAIRKHRPQDATTNPSLLLKAAQMSEYHGLVDEAVSWAKGAETDAARRMEACLDRLAVAFGIEILRVVPGRVSTEVDARLSFDTESTLRRARRIIEMYEAAGVPRERVLIKIASTWEGIRAAERLEREGIHCNLTLLFGFGQAVACAEAGVRLVSPFVGRILDWHKKQRGVGSIPAPEDPGVLSVVRIYDHFKRFGYHTEIMGASFRNVGEIIELAGCDLLTISPALLEELHGMDGALERRLDPGRPKGGEADRLHLDERAFRWMLNEDAMATEKLAEGIRVFAADLVKLARHVSTLF